MSAASRFDLNGARWARADGVLLTETAADLSLGKFLAAPVYSAAGTYVPSGTIATGASTPGDSTATAADTCNGWTSNAASATHRWGWSHLSSTRLFSATISDHTCDMPSIRVICLQD